MPEQSMAERLKRMGSRLTVDDGFHVPTTLDYFWTETNWFAMVIPDRKMTVLRFWPPFRSRLRRELRLWSGLKGYKGAPQARRRRPLTQRSAQR